MASSGALGTSNQYVKYRIDVTQESGKVVENYTPVTVKVVAYRTNTGYTTYGTGNIWCKINGTTYSAGITSSQKITNAGITLFTKKVNIPHNADGTKILYVSAWLSIPGAGLSSSEQGFNCALTTIPRASTISSVVGDVIGEDITVNIKRAAENFTHELWYRIGYSEWFTLGKGYTTSCKFKIDIDKCEYITDSDSAILQLCVRTYGGDKVIGSDYYNYSYKINVPESFVPTILSVSITEAVDEIAEKFALFVQNVSRLNVKVKAEGIYGSTITSYSTEVLGQTYSGDDVSTNIITASEDVTVKITAKDSRGRVATEIRNVNVEKYVPPMISDFSVIRAKKDGTEDPDGEYANCYIKFNISSVANKNTKSYQIECQKKGESTWQTIKSGSVYSFDAEWISSDAVLSADSEYTVRLTIRDYFTSVTAEVALGTGAPIMDFRYSGKGMAIGKVAEKDCLEVAMDAEFHKRVVLKQENEKDVDVLAELVRLNQKIDESKILWSGAHYMNAEQTAVLNGKISEQKNGIVLVFSTFVNSTTNNYEWKSFFIPKKLVELYSGRGHDFSFFSSQFEYMGTKYLYIHDDKIVGYKGNDMSGTAVGTGMRYTNRYWVMRYVIGV